MVKPGGLSSFLTRYAIASRATFALIVRPFGTRTRMLIWICNGSGARSFTTISVCGRGFDFDFVKVLGIVVFLYELIQRVDLCL